MNKRVETILQQVKSGELSVSDAALMLKNQPYADLGYANIDLHRQIRQGATEVIYGAGKTAQQIAGIASALLERGQSRVLITRMDPEKAAKVEAILPGMNYCEMPKLGYYGTLPEPRGGTILVLTGGTSDMPVAEEAAMTAEFLGNHVQRIYDVGVAGIHRLLSHTEDILRANVVIAIAGMEGALASVVGGIADCPVIAVPTSVGYGAAFEGLAALLSMLNACSAGISVVNIDNGFGAGYLASKINLVGDKV